jgi:AcrR family transcriptional regulator
MAVDKASLRQKQATATRDYILSAAFELLVEHPDRPFSHEAVAKAAGVGARTVYRYFPAQSDMFEALWLQVRQHSGTVFPTDEAQIVPSIGILYRAFDQNEKLIRAVMESPAGTRVRARGASEGRASFDRSLRDATQGLSAVERRQVRAVFNGIHSAPFWQMLHDRGGLSASEAIAAASWAAQSLLQTLHRQQATPQVPPTRKGKKGGRTQ